MFYVAFSVRAYHLCNQLKTVSKWCTSFCCKQEFSVIILKSSNEKREGIMQTIYVRIASNRAIANTSLSVSPPESGSQKQNHCYLTNSLACKLLSKFLWLACLNRFFETNIGRSSPCSKRQLPNCWDVYEGILGTLQFHLIQYSHSRKSSFLGFLSALLN